MRQQICAGNVKIEIGEVVYFGVFSGIFICKVIIVNDIPHIFSIFVGCQVAIKPRIKFQKKQPIKGCYVYNEFLVNIYTDRITQHLIKSPDGHSNSFVRRPIYIIINSGYRTERNNIHLISVKIKPLGIIIIFLKAI